MADAEIEKLRAENARLAREKEVNDGAIASLTYQNDKLQRENTRLSELVTQLHELKASASKCRDHFSDEHSGPAGCFGSLYAGLRDLLAPFAKQPELRAIRKLAPGASE